MSTFKRFISGSAASWSRIGITLFSQLALVPLFLSHWTVEEYGCWLATQSFIGFATLLSLGHQTFLGYEFLKIGEKDLPRFRTILYSSFPFAILIAGVELLAVITFIYFGGAQWLLDSHGELTPDLVRQTELVLVIQSVVWVFVSSVGGVVGRAVSPMGYFARGAWWLVASTLVTLLASALAVACGADVLVAGAAQSAATVVINVPLQWDLWRLLRRHGVTKIKMDRRLGISNVFRSLALAAKMLLDVARQQGTRIILSPLVGVKDMAAFSTMRTASNVALQGLSTVTSPMMPELMRFFRQQDQARATSTFCFIWLMIATMMAPGILILQYVAPTLFQMWTRGKVAFDPSVFALMNCTLLVYAIAQPAMAVAQGFNLLKIQLTIAISTGIVALVGLALLTSRLGIWGAALALLVAEGVSTAIYVYSASRWMAENGMSWPRLQFFWVSVNLLLCFAGCFAIANFPKYGLLICSFSLLGVVISAGLLWGAMPQLAKDKVRDLQLRLRK
jgi:O-antigen/teichoic acid export membrane protein